jgi:tight adherence protein B
MRRALGEVQMGSTVDSALMRVAERVDSEDLRWTVSALAIQREVGGNLSRILETASATVKSRAELTREVRTLSAEGRLSAGILVALPIGMFGFLALTRREYVQVFWTTGAGIMMLVVITLLITGGWLWMRRVVRIEV